MTASSASPPPGGRFNAGAAGFVTALVLGAGVLAWVALAGVRGQPVALAMTAAIAFAYAMGAAELWRFRRDTQALHTALAAPPGGDPAPAWIDGLPLPLRAPVRRRLDGERVALPGPALAPYLVGLLVLLGMLGTFLGLVLTLDGTVGALERSADLAAMRAALAAPVKGLGLAFGSSVAGVAASAMLGLMLALARGERAAAGRALDRLLAGPLRTHTTAARRDQQRDAQLHRIAQALEAQAAALPGVANAVQAQVHTLLQRLDERDAAQRHALLDGQAQWQRDTREPLAALAASVERSLGDALARAAQAAAAALQPAAEATMAGIARESAAVLARLDAEGQARLQLMAQQQAQAAQALQAALQARANELVATLQQAQDRQRAESEARDARRQADWTAALQAQAAQLQQQAQQAAEQAARAQAALAESLAQRTEALQQQLATQTRETLAQVALLAERAAEAPSAAATLLAQLREQVSDSLRRDQALLAERGQLAQALATLVDDARGQAEAQRAAVQALVDGAQTLLASSHAQHTQALQAASQQQAEAATRLAAGAVEVASLGEALAATVMQFGATGAALSERLAQIEGALAQSAARHDEQLAYYVAQARELIELGVATQQPLLEALQRVGAAESA